MATLRLTETSLVVEELDCSDPEVVEFFTDTAEPARADLACRALTMGVVGSRAMGITGHVELVEREFFKLSQRFDTALGAVEENLLERVSTTFDPDKAESVSGRLTESISGAHTRDRARDSPVRAGPSITATLARDGPG